MSKATEKVRVYALAKEAGVTSKEMLEKLQDLGYEVKSVQSTLSREDADAVLAGGKKKKTRKAPAKKATKAKTTKAKSTKAKSTKKAKEAEEAEEAEEKPKKAAKKTTKAKATKAKSTKAKSTKKAKESEEAEEAEEKPKKAAKKTKATKAKTTKATKAKKAKEPEEVEESEEKPKKATKAKAAKGDSAKSKGGKKSKAKQGLWLEGLDSKEFASTFIKNALLTFEIESEVEIRDASEGEAELSITAEGLQALSNYKTVINQLLYLLGKAVHYKYEENVHYTLRLNTSEEEGEEARTLAEVASELIERLGGLGKCVMIDALNSHERRTIHTAIAEHPTGEAQTISDGEGIFRRLIIAPASMEVPNAPRAGGGGGRPRSNDRPRGGDRGDRRSSRR